MLTPDDKAGLYFTAIIHLAVLIVLLIAQIGFSFHGESTFIMDFSKTEEAQKQQAKAEFDKKINERIARMIAGEDYGMPIRNTTSSRNSEMLKDDRNTDAEKLYEDADRLAAELKRGNRAASDEEENYVAVHDAINDNKPETKMTYSGPTVLSWHLDGRRPEPSLPIPAYRCYNGGMVTVVISVDNSGNVIKAEILEEGSSEDSCLRNFALRAARMSKFSPSSSAPSRQTGDIIYQFIAQ